MIHRRLSLISALAFTTGCAFGTQPPELQPVTIRVVEDTVRLFRSPDGASLRASVRVHNRSEAVLYVDHNCPAAVLQRQIGTQWQTVWDNQICLLAHSSPKQVAPGDSTTVFARFYGFTGVSREPTVDRRVAPGVYRLLVRLGSTVDEEGMRIAKWFPPDKRSSEPFTVYEVQRP